MGLSPYLIMWRCLELLGGRSAGARLERERLRESGLSACLRVRGLMTSWPGHLSGPPRQAICCCARVATLPSGPSLEGNIPLSPIFLAVFAGFLRFSVVFDVSATWPRLRCALQDRCNWVQRIRTGVASSAEGIRRQMGRISGMPAARPCTKRLPNTPLPGNLIRSAYLACARHNYSLVRTDYETCLRDCWSVATTWEAAGSWSTICTGVLSVGCA